MGINLFNSGLNSSILQNSLSLAQSAISNPLGIGVPPALMGFGIAQPQSPLNVINTAFATPQMAADPFMSFSMAFPGFGTQQQVPGLIGGGGILNGLVGGRVGQQSTLFLNGLLGGVIGNNSLGVVQGILGDQGSFNNTLNSLLTSMLTGGGGATAGVMQGLFSGGAGNGQVGGNADLSGALGNAFNGLNSLGVLGLSYAQVEQKIKSSGTLIPSLLTSAQGKAGLLGGTETNIFNLTKGINGPPAPAAPAPPGSALALARQILGKPNTPPAAPAAAAQAAPTPPSPEGAAPPPAPPTPG